MDDVDVMKKSGAKSRTRESFGGRRSASRTDGAAHATVVNVSAADEPQRSSVHEMQSST
jgi:transposase-like protein